MLQLSLILEECLYQIIMSLYKNTQSYSPDKMQKSLDMTSKLCKNMKRFIYIS